MDITLYFYFGITQVDEDANMVFVEYYGEGNPIMSGMGFNHGKS